MQYECAAFIIDTWLEAAAQGRTNIAPSKIPWDLIRSLIQIIYGGKIDDEMDAQQLSGLLQAFLTPAAFELDYKLVQAAPPEDGMSSKEGNDGLTVPEGNDVKTFLTWVDDLPEREPPTYLGLPANAEKLLLVGHGKKTIENLVKITELLEENEQVHAEANMESAAES